MYVSAEQSDEVVVIDPARARVMARIGVGKRPRGIALSRDGAQLYVAQTGSPRAGPNVDESSLPPADRAADGVGVVGLSEQRMLRSLSAGRDPETFALSHDGRSLFVANEETAELSQLDLASGKVTHRFAVGRQPEGVAVRPDDAVVYVACEEDDVVVAVDVHTGAVLARIATGKRPRAIAFRQDGHEAFVTNELDASLTVIDTQQQRAVATIALAGDAGHAPVRPMGIVRSADGKHMYVSTGRGGSIIEVEIAGRKRTRVFADVGARPWGIALSRDGRHLYSANGPSNDLTIVELDTGKLRHVAVGGSPWGVVSTQH